MKEDSKFEKRCANFNHCHFSKTKDCEGCNIYEYTHHFEELMVKLQKLAKWNRMEKYLKYYNSLIS